MSSEITTEHRLTKLEEGQQLILTNHLPHLQAAMDSLEIKLDKANNKLWGILLVILTAALGLIGSMIYLIRK